MPPQTLPPLPMNVSLVVLAAIVLACLACVALVVRFAGRLPADSGTPSLMAKYAAGAILFGMVFVLVLLNRIDPSVFLTLVIAALATIGVHANATLGSVKLPPMPFMQRPFPQPQPQQPRAAAVTATAVPTTVPQPAQPAPAAAQPVPAPAPVAQA